MMKNKKLTYFLIAIVLGVWGLILYRIFDAVGATDDAPMPVATKQGKEVFNDFSIPKDTAKLLLNYRDPFGITKPKDTTIKISGEISRKNISTTPKPVMNWSFISYSGYVRNPTSKKLIALVSINGQNITLAEGETKNQVKLLKNLRDSIKISYEGKTKFIVIKSAAL
jgi:hypothetical protein